MFLILTGFTKSEREFFYEQNKGRIRDFSIGDCMPLGRIVETTKEWQDELGYEHITDVVRDTQAGNIDNEDVIKHLSEFRFFFNPSFDKIFGIDVAVELNDEGEPVGETTISVTFVPYPFFFFMLDRGKLTFWGYENAESELQDPDNLLTANETKLMEKGFLSPYLAITKISKYSAFLLEANNFDEFRALTHFIVELGEKKGHTWKKPQENVKEDDNEGVKDEGNEEDNESNKESN